MKVAYEKARLMALWQKIFEATTFEERCDVVQEMSTQDRAMIFLHEEDGEWFIKGVDGLNSENEARYLREWAEMRKIEEAKGNLPYAG